MTQQERPPRSLRRDGGGPRYYRDWSAADEVISQQSYMPAADEVSDQELDALLDGPQDLQMVDGFEEPAPAPSRPVVQPEMAPLNVVVPETPKPAAPATPAKPTITRVDRPRVQRARRFSEIQAEEEAQKQAEKKEQVARQASTQLSPPDRSPKTRTLSKSSTQTTELQANLKDIGGKLDEAKENVKSTANALSENIRQVSEKITVSVVSGIQQVGKTFNRWLGRVGKHDTASRQDEEYEQDFEDDPLPSTSPVVAPAQPEPSSASKKENLLDRVPKVPAVMYADLLKEKVLFLTFDKEQLVESPEKLSAKDLQAVFLENAINDIRKCIKLVRDLPDPTEGPYQGIPLAYIFKHVREQDLYFFMHYVLSKPGPFVKKTFKISEAFATWIIKRSHTTEVAEPFPEVPALSYAPLYKDNIRFQTFDRKQMVLASGKSAEELDQLFVQRAMEDVRQCLKLVEKFPSAEEGPYRNKPLKQIFRYVQERDIYFFLHYIKAQPEVFRGQNFKFSEAFASWILKRSHETQLP